MKGHNVGSLLHATFLLISEGVWLLEPLKIQTLFLTFHALQ